jgi:transketolase
MELGEREFKKIGEYVKSHLKEWIAESGANLGAGAAEGADSEKSEGSKIGEEALALRRRELDLVERVERVEDELKNLRELMEERFSKMDERFEAQRELMNERFDHMEKRTSFSQWIIGIGFTAIGLLILVLNYFR